jgi:hypothetical protein
VKSPNSGSTHGLWVSAHATIYTQPMAKPK